jgi:hypothetical protein
MPKNNGNSQDDGLVPQPHGGALKPFQPGQSGNPAGKPKGAIHLSTHIQNLLNDDDFTAWIQDPRTGIKEFKGAPVKAMISALIVRAVNGDVKAFDVLAKHGYGTHVDHTTNGKDLPTPILNGISTASDEVPDNNSTS